MKKVLTDLNVFYIRYYQWGALLAGLIFVLLLSYRQIAAPRLTTDFISWALSSMAPVFDIGHPYINYWGINPPGVLLMTGLWGTLVGSSLQSFHVLYILCVSAIIYLVWRILGKILNPYFQTLLFGFFCFYFFNSSVQSQFFPSEINGFLFSLIGLNILLKKKLSSTEIFIAHAVFIFAGQMKEVFALQGLTVLPHLLYALNQGRVQTVRFMTYAIGGVLGAVLVLLLYLAANDSIGAYRDITSYKSTQFSLMDVEKIGTRLYRSLQFPRDRFFYLRYQIPTFLLFSTIPFLIWLSIFTRIDQTTNKKSASSQFSISIPVHRNTFIYTVVFFYWFSALLGYAIQGRYGNKYDIEPLLPTLLIITLAVLMITNSLKNAIVRKSSQKLEFIASIFAFVVVSIMLIPQKVFLLEPYFSLRSYDLANHIRLWQVAESNEVLALEHKITAHTKSSDCITSVYGWGVGETYYYSRRPSCSKHFLVNILPEGEYSKYRSDLRNNPPSVIVYTHAGADLDTGKFERTVFNFPAVLEACYSPDETFDTLYWAKFSKKDMPICIEKYDQREATHGES